MFSNGMVAKERVRVDCYYGRFMSSADFTVTYIYPVSWMDRDNK